MTEQLTQRLRVLYVEDNPTDADLTKAHFEFNAPEFALDIVDSGGGCMDRLQDGRYDVLLLDNKLRDMYANDILKELSAKNVSLPVVVVTAAGDEALVVQVLRLGALDYVIKQGDYIQSLPSVLKNAIADYGRARESLRAFGRNARRILYIEHHSADIDLTLKHFADAGANFQIEVAKSAAQGLARLQEERFDLALTDLRMPDMNALDLLREARQRAITVPFIIITGNGDEAAAVAALKLGAYDYLSKRDDYLSHLPYAIDNAIARSELAQINHSLQTELAERERAQAENARLLADVLEQRQRLDDIVDSVPGIVWEAWGRPGAAEHRLDFVSSHIEHMLGYNTEQWLSIPNFWLSIVHPDDRERAASEARKFFATGTGGVSQFRWIAKGGHEVWVESLSTVICDQNGTPIGMRGVTMDITARKKAEEARVLLEEQLRQTLKFESIGRLAGGIAHDFNNLLTVINGYSDLILEQLDPADPLSLSVSQISRAGKRARDLTRQLLAFSRRQLLQPRVLGLNALIADSSKMLKRILGEDIDFVTIPAPELGWVYADAGQMDQVLLNLAVNARDAMPQGGRLTIETRNIVLDEPFVETHLTIHPGSYVMLGVSDNGSGMDSETLSRIFEPFFTTKEKGTGLGLSTVYGIVQQSGGSIWTYSEPGRGTTFKIYLPRIEDPPAPVDDRRSEVENNLRGSETILVVEDEEMVRRLICVALRQRGYQVIETANAGEALLACEKHTGAIPLMITDVVMPQMSGRELAERLLNLRPQMRVLYMSGYTDDAVVRHGLLDTTFCFLEKPFTPAALAEKVRDVLGSTPCAPER